MRIVFYPAQAGKRWDGSSLEREPLGGSETAVIYVSRELAKRGHEVIVFSRGEPGLHQDVLYLPFEEARAFLRTTPIDALVCSRDPLPLLWASHAQKRVLWLHDLPQGRYPEADAYVCVSMWQAQVYLQHKLLPQERTRVIGNGIDPALFERTATIHDDYVLDEEGVNLVWTSNPERGLWHAAEVARRLRKKIGVDLHVFGRNDVYGWNTGYEHTFYPDDMTRVLLHQPMPKARLARELANMDLWVYPTWWPETYCIAAVEAQAAGVPVVASALGALNETCLTQELVPGSMREDAAGQEEHLTNITDAVYALICDPARRQQLATAGRAYALEQSWAKQAQRWETLLRQ